MKTFMEKVLENSNYIKPAYKEPDAVFLSSFPIDKKNRLGRLPGDEREKYTGPFEDLF